MQDRLAGSCAAPPLVSDSRRTVHRRRVLMGLGAAVAAPVWASERAAETVRVAFIDPLSGPAGDIGRNSLRSWEFMARALSGPNHASGVRFVVAGFDNKGSPKLTLDMLKAALDQGFRYIVQGNGSGVAAAISDALARHNLRHPDRSALYLNYAANDPALTNEKCSFWHFRLDADTAMKTRALARFLAEQPHLRKVYLLNQNYAHGQQLARYFRQAMLEESALIEVVGDELHSAFAGQDFGPYVRRIQDTGAQALVTGNWGADLRDLVTALQAARVRVPLYAYYPSLKGVPRALASAKEPMPVFQVAYNHTNQEGHIGELARAFERETGEDLVVLAAYDGLALLLHAIGHAGTTDPMRVAARMSGAIFNGFNGPVQMRADDHQLLKGLYLSRWQPVDARYPVDAEGTGHTFAPLRFMPASDLVSASQCQMQRP